MNDAIPDFEPPAPMFEDPKPAKKPRRKPAKKRAVYSAPAPKPKPRKVGRRKTGRARKSQVAAVKRRGRPAGVPNKPKAPAQEVFLSDAVYKTIRTLADLTAGERDMVFSIVRGLTK
jgi:hypothetical protein